MHLHLPIGKVWYFHQPCLFVKKKCKSFGLEFQVPYIWVKITSVKLHSFPHGKISTSGSFEFQTQLLTVREASSFPSFLTKCFFLTPVLFIQRGRREWKEEREGGKEGWRLGGRVGKRLAGWLDACMDVTSIFLRKVSTYSGAFLEFILIKKHVNKISLRSNYPHIIFNNNLS